MFDGRSLLSVALIRRAVRSGSQWFDRITVNPQQMSGQPCIRGMRLTVRRVVEAVSVYADRAELFREFPEIDEADVKQALEFAASLEDRNIDVRMA